MSLSTMGFSGALAVVLIFYGYGHFHAGQEIVRQGRLIEVQLQAADVAMEKLKETTEESTISIKDGYSRVHDAVKKMSHFLDMHFGVEIDGLKGSGEIAQALKESRFPGVNDLAMKISFMDVHSPDASVQILKLFSNLEKRLPLEIIIIHGVDKMIDADIQLYGGKMS